MKSLVKYVECNSKLSHLCEYIKEAQMTAFDGEDFFFKNKLDSEYLKRIGYKYYNKDTELPSFEEIENAYATTSNVTGDPSFGNIDGVGYSKIKEDQWLSSSSHASILGGSINNKTVYDAIQKSSQWYLMLRPEDKKKS